jgi:hypothetical protein
MKERLIFVLPILLVLIFQFPVYAAPEDDYPDFYTDVSWSIPSGMEGNTVPTKFIPSLDNTNGHYPILKQGFTSTHDFKNFHMYFRDYTQTIIGDASTPEMAAKRLFYEIRDSFRTATNRFFGATMALKGQFGQSNDKAVFLAACLRSAKVPARLVLVDGVMDPRTLNYNKDFTQDTGTDVISSEAAGTTHVYVEAYINDSWVSLDPTWSSDLAFAFDIAKFGEKEKSIAVSGPRTTASDYPDSYLAAQPHPYRFVLGENVNPATYEEDSEYDNFPIFEPLDDYNDYIQWVRYKSTISDMAGVIRNAIAECDEYIDLNPSSHPGAEKIASAKEKLEKAQEKLANGESAQAKKKIEEACKKIGDVPGLYDDLDLMKVRYNLSNLWMYGTKGVLISTESYPRTFNWHSINFNTWESYGYKYGTIYWDEPPMEECVKFDFSNFGYNPRKRDMYTYLKDPTRFYDYTNSAFTPTVLMDVLGNTYEPASVSYEWVNDNNMNEFGHDRGGHHFRMAVPNGLPDFSERGSVASWGRATVIGGGDTTELHNDWWWVRVVNKLYDEYGNLPVRFSTRYRENAFEDIVLRLLNEQGVQDIQVETLFASYADASHFGFFEWLPEIIAQSDNPGAQWHLTKGPDRFNYDSEWLEGVVYNGDAVDKIANASGKVAILVRTHGFPSFDRDYSENVSPGTLYSDPCGYAYSRGWIPSPDYPCNIFGVPVTEGCNPPQPNGYPNGWVYGEDNYHLEAIMEYEEFKTTIEELIAQNPNITDYYIWNLYNMFAMSNRDPYGQYDMDFPEPGDEHMKWGNNLSSQEAYVAAKELGVDEIIDWPFYWHSAGRDQLQGGRTMSMHHDMAAMVSGVPYGDMPYNKMNFPYWDDNYNTVTTTPDGIKYTWTDVGIGGPDTNWPAVNSLYRQIVRELSSLP